ncbi:ABC transporter ATP-binding protein [Alloiococcus sp. CFN-8]|uniref:ABC transporter ATP-binding protein n=1 Tax=Alloiococcus sp. CFN-8 TaxID=3416081 RepID=UPI003CF19D48
MLEVIGVSKSYGRNKVLKNVSFKIFPGELLFLLGKNGAGKTTLLNIISSIHSMTKGEVLINGFSIKDRPIEAKRSLGYIVDDIKAFEFLTGGEFLEFIASVYKLENKDRIIKRYVTLFQMDDCLNQLISTYSSGMKKKIMIISCLIRNPPVLIMDEPTNGLDIGSHLVLFNEIRSLASKKTILIATHDRFIIEGLIAMGIKSRIAIIKDGRIAALDTLDNLKRRYHKRSVAEVFLEVYKL